MVIVGFHIEAKVSEPFVEQSASDYLEQDQEFSRSRIWQWQRDYYVENGVSAWQKGNTPHYITSNPRIAHNYAEIVMGFYRDLCTHGALKSEEPIYILELGAGTGRFSFHFLRRLQVLCKLYGIDIHAFRYIISDLVPNNIDFCNQHPHLGPYFESGILDLAQVDLSQVTSLQLIRSGQLLTVASLQNSLIVIANYVFDSLPHHLFHFDGESVYLGFVTLHQDKTENPDRMPENLAELQPSLGYKKVTGLPFENVAYNNLLENYHSFFKKTHLLFPAYSLDVLDALRAISSSGMMLLTADKGTHLLAKLDDMPPPPLVQHGSFSVSVNYHAFADYCEQEGGLALFPDEPWYHIDVGCLLFVSAADNYLETIRAYRQQLMDFGPDAAQGHAEFVRNNAQYMSLREIFVYLQLSMYDSYVFDGFLPRLLEIAPEISGEEKANLLCYLDRIWEEFYPIGEPLCVANQVACLLYQLNEYEKAYSYFQQSVEINGPNTGALYNMALCCREMGQSDVAIKLLHQVLKYDPKNDAAKALLDQ